MSFEAVKDRIDVFLAAHPAAENGPAHVVLGDYNVEDCHIGWALSRLSGATDAESVAVTTFLRELLAVPEAERVRCADGHRYDCERHTDGSGCECRSM